MLVAIRKSDNLKVIGEKIEKDNKAFYYCECCKKEVIHHKSESRIKIGHFKHKIGQSNCPNTTNETQWHFNTKLNLSLIHI